MKYSQAVVVACIGGAALVSAVPTRPKGKQSSGANNHKSSKLERTGKNLGNGVRLGSTFALAAGGNPPSANQPLPEEQTTATTQQTVKSRELPKKKSKGAKLRTGASKLKQAGQQAVQKAGGSTAVAEGLGNMYNFAQSQQSSSDSTTLRRDLASAETANEPTTPTTPEAQAPHHQKKKKGGKKRLSSEEKKAKAEKWRNMDPQAKAELKAKHKGHKKGSHPGSNHNSESTTPGNTTPPPTPNTPSAPLSRREVAAPDTSAADSTTQVKPATPQTPAPHLIKKKKKGSRKHLTAEEKKAKAEKWKNMDPQAKAELKAKHKGHKKGNHPGSTTPSSTDETSTPSTPSTPSVAARDFDDMDGGLLARELIEELDARGIWSKLKGNYKERKEQSKMQSQQQFESPPLVPRDFFDEEELELRDFDDYDELEMRSIWSKVKGIFGKGKKSVDPTSMIPPPSQDYNTPQRRDLTEDEGLVLRGLVDFLDERDLDSNDLEARGLTEDEELMLRDLEDHLDARDIGFNDLEARGKLRNIFGAIKDTFKGKKPGMSTDPTMTSDPTLQVRDLLEDLDARDIFEELDELD